MRVLILTPNETEVCGMYQLAKDLAKEFDGIIKTQEDMEIIRSRSYIKNNFDEIITLLYPMHWIGYLHKRDLNIKWICYNQGIPPITKQMFPNFWRRLAMRYINWRNNATMQGADEYWDVTEREQKPRWTKKTQLRFLAFDGVDLTKPYSIYIGRTTDYKNYDRLKSMMEELSIPLIHLKNVSDELLCEYLSNAKMLVTASLWEGFGRSVNDAEALGIPAVAYDVGTHKKNIKKGICVPLDLNNMRKSEEDFKKAVLEVWQRETNKKPD